METTKIGFFLLLMFFLAMSVPALASQCIDCHTNAGKLKAITQSLPQPEASAETAGKG